MTVESEKRVERTPRQHGAMEFSEAPVDLDTVRQDRLSRLRLSMAKHDVAGLLLFDQINTRYATDATNMQVWCSHYETRCVFIAQNGPVVLFDYANHPHLAEDLPGIDEYRVIPSFYFFSAGPNGPDRVKIFADQIDDLMRAHCGDDRVLGVDPGKVIDEFLLEGGVDFRQLGSQVVLLADVLTEVEEGEIGVLQFGDKGVPIRGVLPADLAP